MSTKKHHHTARPASLWGAGLMYALTGLALVVAVRLRTHGLDHLLSEPSLLWRGVISW